MSKKEMKTKSGVELVISPADFEAVMDLQSAILSELSTSNFDLEVNELSNVSDLLPIVAKVGASKDITKALFDCLKHCTYNKHKITRATFDDFEARSDYYEIIIECAKFNLQPFFGGLLSGLNSSMQTLTESQKSK